MLQYYGGSPEKPQVVVLEPTGVVSINVSGADRVMPIILVTLVAFRNKHSEVQLIVLDKISMVSKKECYQMHYCCVTEIFNLSNWPFDYQLINISCRGLSSAFYNSYSDSIWHYHRRRSPRELNWRWPFI